MAHNYMNIPQPFPRIFDYSSGKTMEQQYADIKEMRSCITALIHYAANLALSGEQELLPDLREMVVTMGPFWEDQSGTDADTEWLPRKEEQYGAAFDKAVSSALESNQAPAMNGRKVEQIFAGLNLHAEERSFDQDTYGIWRCCRVCRRLQQEWGGKTKRPLVFNGGFEVDNSDTFTNFGSKGPEDVEFGGLLGRPVLIFNHPIEPEAVPPSWHCYYLTGRDIVHPDKLVDEIPEEGYAGTVLSPFSLKRPSYHSCQINGKFWINSIHVSLDEFCSLYNIEKPDLCSVFQEQTAPKQAPEIGGMSL